MQSTFSIPGAPGSSGLSPMQRLQMARDSVAPAPLASAQLPSLSPLDRVRAASAVAGEQQRQRDSLTERVAAAVSALAVGSDAMAELRKSGVLQVEMKFQKCDPHGMMPNVVSWQRGLKTVQFSLENIGEVPGELGDAIRQKVQGEIQPKYLNVSCTAVRDYRGAPPRNIIDRIYMIVSDCRIVLRMDEAGFIRLEERAPTSHIHQGAGLNAAQTILHETEGQFDRASVDDEKVKKTVEKIFDPQNGWSAFNMLVNKVQNRQVTGKLWLRLVFNHTESPYNRIPVKEGTYFTENLQDLNLYEIALLFNRIQMPGQLGKRPVCQYTIQTAGYKGEMDMRFGSEGCGIKNQNEPVIADYLIQE